MPSPRAREFVAWLEQEIAELPPDAGLPSDKVLASQWRLSVPTVQRMLARLRDQGKVVRIPGKGTFVPRRDETAKPSIEIQSGARRQSSVEQLSEAFLRLIREGVFRKGQALPPVKYIRRQFRVSPETVFQACQRLQSQGYIEKVGKVYWVGRMEEILQAGPTREVYFFRFSSSDFTSIFQSDPLALAYQKMERELWAHGYFLHPADTDQLPELSRRWARKKAYPDGVIFHEALEHHIPLIQSILEREMKWKAHRGIRVLVDACKGNFVPLTGRMRVISRGNLDTNIARVMAHYLASRGYREANFCFDERELSTTSKFHGFFKIALAVKSLDPNFVFRSIVRPGRDADRNRPFFQSLIPRYQEYLLEKYPGAAFPSLENQLILTHDVFETCMRFRGARIWLFSTDSQAAEALQWLKQRNVRVPEDVALVGFQGDPRYYHLGLSCCSANWEQMGYVMAHAVIGDLPLGKTSKGFLKVQCQMVDKLTTPRRAG